MGWFAEEPGGLNRMYAGLLGAFAARGRRTVGLVAGRAEGHGAAPAPVRAFARREAPLHRRLLGCRRAAKTVLAGNGVEVVAAHFALYALPLLDLVRDRRFVFHFHGPWADESAVERQRGVGVAAKRMVEACVYRRADRLIVLSQAFAAVLARRYGVREDRICVVPGGVDVSRFATELTRREARCQLGLPTDRPIIGVVRRLVHRVGLEGMLDALAIITRRIPDALLVVGGTGPLAGPLEQRARDLGVGDHVRFLGYIDDELLPVLYRACDVSVVPSLALEGFGLTTIESLAAGTPVLVTPIGGLPETVHDLDPRLVLPDCRPASLANGIVAALAGEHVLPPPDACTAYARRRFDWPVIAEQVLNVYG